MVYLLECCPCRKVPDGKRNAVTVKLNGRGRGNAPGIHLLSPWSKARIRHRRVIAIIVYMSEAGYVIVLEDLGEYVVVVRNSILTACLANDVGHGT